MKEKFILQLPRRLPDFWIFVLGVGVLVSLGTADYLFGEAIRLYGLYTFPIAFIALYCDGDKEVIASVIIAGVMQTFVLFSYDHALQTKVVSSLVSFTVIILVAFLAQKARLIHEITLHEAGHDALTGLCNRRRFELLLAEAIVRQKRHGTGMSLAIVDLDQFKALNDTRGHRAGDEALRLAATVLSANTRKSDLVARLGGDEFALLMSNLSREESASLCSKLVGKIAEAMALSGFPITISIGCKFFDKAPADNSIAFELSDRALYLAKRRGRNCAVSH